MNIQTYAKMEKTAVVRKTPMSSILFNSPVGTETIVIPEMTSIKPQDFPYPRD